MRKFNWLLVVFLFVALAGCEEAVERSSQEETFIIEDFDAGMPPNYLGGDYGAWESNPDDSTQSSEISFDTETRVGDSGYSLKIEYDVDSDNPAFNGFWMKLNGESFESYEQLGLSIKGNEAAGFTTRVKLELKNQMDETGTYTLSGITDEWQEVNIPLRNFRGLRDLSAMDEFVVVFEDTLATVKKGAIYIDNIYVR